MILGDVFERFVQDSPLSVMARGVMENALNPAVVDRLFEDVAERQYTRKLLFSSIVDLMGLVVRRIRPAIHAAYQAHAETVDAKDLWIEDRNFCTTNFLFGIARREAFFVVRQHAANLRWEFAGERRGCGGIDTGEVFEQAIRAVDEAGEILVLRRITVALDAPTQDGETELHLLTNAPAEDADASTVAELYRRRWTIEAAFQELAATLDGEVAALGCPKAALRSVHGEEVVAEEVSGYYMADEISMTRRGMMIAIPEDEWVVFHGLTPVELAGVLVELAKAVRLPRYKKHARGPKKPQPKRQSGAEVKHVSTARLLAARRKRTE